MRTFTLVGIMADYTTEATGTFEVVPGSEKGKAGLETFRLRPVGTAGKGFEVRRYSGYAFMPEGTPEGDGCYGTQNATKWYREV